MKRYLHQRILSDLQKKMVFLTGPRQVGKTYLSNDIALSFKSPQYLNFDNYLDQKIITSQKWDPKSDLLVFDEIHKMSNWKPFLKGVYDKRQQGQAFLITGSARMDTFRQTGESLAGRYFHYRLHPFSVRELSESLAPHEILKKLILLGGFPEPFLDGTDTGASRWRNQYFTDLVREDVPEYSRIHEIRTMRLLLQSLRLRTGSPLSFNALAGDFQTSPNTIRRYVDILESLYVVFLVRPYHVNIARAITKEPKLYFFDGSFPEEESRRLENIVALALLKHCDFQHDAFGRNLTLHYLRDKEKREVDFVLVENAEPVLFAEVKIGDDTPALSLKYYHKRFPSADAVQLVMRLRERTAVGGIRVVDAAEWLAELSA